MKLIKTILMFTATGSVFLGSCSKEGDAPKGDLNIPTTYESVDFDTNTYQERVLSGRFINFVSLMKQGEDPAVTHEMSVLQSAWNEGGSGSLNAHSGWMAAEVSNNLLPELVKHSGRSYHPDYGDTATLGGVFEGRLLNEGAFEILQGVDKGSYAGLFLHQILELKKGIFNLKALDRMLALYGAHPSFPNTPTAVNTPYPDQFIANYTARRDKNDGTGFYSRIKTEFLTLRAAITAGDEFAGEKEAAFERLIQNMEKALAATSINYMNSAITKLSKTNPTDADKAGALHDLSEALGFIQGFYQLNSTYLTISKVEIETVLGFMHYDGQNYRYFEFTNDPANTLPDILKAIDKLQSIYQFTSAEMIDFKTNWVGAQGR